jgi:hypothetical protein
MIGRRRLRFRMNLQETQKKVIKKVMRTAMKTEKMLLTTRDSGGTAVI